MQLDLKSFEIIRSSKFKDLIDDDKKCIELISSVLEFSTEAIFMNRHRASHIIVTWVLGVGLSNFVKNGKVLICTPKVGQTFGVHIRYRRITLTLQAKGMKINHKKVQMLMKMLNIRGKTRKNGKYHSYKGEVGKVADNLLNRDFHAESVCEKLTTDVTQFNVCATKVYLSPIMDLYNNEIMSYSISLHPDLAQIREMLDGLSKKLPKGVSPILHSDQG